ncbi:MAG: hypothetical protein HY840_13035 [Bacteroidetes bacterium]|nr:hypothetical protein [Bacteroidota bacterium]
MKHKSLFVTCVVVAFGHGFLSCGNQKKEEIKEGQAIATASCTYSRDEKDKVGKRIRVVAEEAFMTIHFPDSVSQPKYKGEDLLKGYMSCVSVDTVIGVNLSFLIRMADADESYGGIKKGNKISFILKSGKTIELSFGSTFSGNTNLSKESTEYLSFAHLSKSAVEQLKLEELQSVMISWSKKEETYAVINPKVFINQLPCVE